MAAAKPSLELLRELSDGHVLRALMDTGRATRAELATATGISKPTVAEAVRRLVAAGVVADTGERTIGPGRVGTYFALAPGVGVALAVVIAPDGIVAEAVDVHGAVVATQRATVARPAKPHDVAGPLHTVCTAVAEAVGAPVRLAVVSAADPVDRATGRLVHQPDAPFLVGELSPVEVLADVVEGGIHVDNDVNWAARAERSAAAPGELDDAFYLYLGEGLGGAVISDGEVRRGHGGLAGEVMHVLTIGPGGKAMPFTEVFARLDLRRAGTAAIDLAAIDRVLSGRTARDRTSLETVARAVAGVVAAVVGLADPSVVVLGGPWGPHPAFVDAVTQAVARLARPVSVRAAAVTDVPSFAGARAAAVERLRAVVTDYRAHAPGRGVSGAPRPGG